MATLRTPEMKAKYKAYQAEGGLAGACVLCEKPALQTFGQWKIIDNMFPYDRVAKTHHMLVPLRHAAEAGLSDGERAELLDIKRGQAMGPYEYMLEATAQTLSIPQHFHLHLIVTKDFE
jgi:hypothetical protein